VGVEGVVMEVAAVQEDFVSPLVFPLPLQHRTQLQLVVAAQQVQIMELEQMERILYLVLSPLLVVVKAVIMAQIMQVMVVLEVEADIIALHPEAPHNQEVQVTHHLNLRHKEIPEVAEVMLIMQVEEEVEHQQQGHQQHLMEVMVEMAQHLQSQGHL